MLFFKDASSSSSSAQMSVVRFCTSSLHRLASGVRIPISVEFRETRMAGKYILQNHIQRRLRILKSLIKFCCLAWLCEEKNILYTCQKMLGTKVLPSVIDGFVNGLSSSCNFNCSQEILKRLKKN